MEDQRPDAPELELTAGAADGEDALQLSPADVPDAAVSLGDGFSIKTHKTEAPTLPQKASKPVTAEANDSVVAALMGRSIGTAKPAAAAPATLAPAIAAAPSETSAESVAAPGAIQPAASSPTTINIQPARPVQPAAIRVQHRPTDAASDSLSRYAGAGPGRGSSSDEKPSTVAPVYRESGLEAASAAGKVPASPPPRRAVPVAPVWPPAPGHAAATPAPVADKVELKPSAIPTPPPRLYVPPSTPAVRPAAPVGTPAVLTPAFSMARSSAPAETEEPAPPAGSTGAWWTIPLTFVGIAIVACAMLIPAADENRRDTYELAKIEQDVDYFDRQSAVNQDFLHRINTDATLAERLAQRQLHQTRQGVKIAQMGGHPDRFGGSPYAMTRLDPPPPLPAYQPVPGRLTEWFLGGQQPQQMAAMGIVVAGAGVCLGGLRRRQPI